MFEDKTFDAILSDALASMGTDIIKNEGSLAYNAASALAMEIEKLYVQMGWLIDQMDPATADYDSLIKLGAQRGLAPKGATYATVKIVADAELPIGSRFNLATLNYVVISQIEGLTYVGVCETAGTAANGVTGLLTPITYVPNLTEARITEVLVTAQNADTRESFLKTYLDSFGAQRYGGNVADYKAWATAHDGVGGARIYPVWNGSGTVKVVCCANAGGKISDTLMQQLQQECDPDPGKGYGFAPIDHVVTIATVGYTTVNISASYTLSSGAVWETVQQALRTAYSNLLTKLRLQWADSDSITLRISSLMSEALSIEGVVDVTNMKINGSTANLTFAGDNVPIIGTVTRT